MSEARVASAPPGARKDEVLLTLKNIVSELSGIAPEEIDIHATFSELGAESLFLLQASQSIQSRLGVRIPFRSLFEEFSDLDSLSTHIEQQLPPAQMSSAQPAKKTSVIPPPSAREQQPQRQRAEPHPSAQEAQTLTSPAGSVVEEALSTPADNSDRPAALDMAQQMPDNLHALTGASTENSGFTVRPVDGQRALSGSSTLERIVAYQLRVMSEQLSLLRNGGGGDAANKSTGAIDASASTGVKPTLLDAQQTQEAVSHLNDAVNPKSTQKTKNEPQASRSLSTSPKIVTVAQDTQKHFEQEEFVPYQPIKKGPADGLTPGQRKHLEELIARINARTGESKRLTQAYRPYLADNRASAGFRMLWKEMFYPLVVQRAQGSKIWDVDGHEYVDITMGFGSLLFGHSPSFVMDALKEQAAQGIQLGPQSHMAGRVARLVCEMTGSERAAFFNSGTEAVMTALRLARTITGRSKIAVFSGAFHGTFDGVLVRAGKTPDGKLRAVPLAPGIPEHMIEDVLMLPYNNPESLDVLKEHMHELAAVLVEPLQSRRPDLQPKGFLKELRRMTEEAGTALIFDEVVVGFRMHPGGVQALFDIRADLVTYGKAVGAGMPIGIVAGKALYMDAIDGGMWNYGDASYPQAETTFFAGTFFKHPFVMAAAWASLNHMKSRGPALQEELSQRTARLAETLNNYFRAEEVPLEVVHFGSLFRLIAPPEIKYLSLLFYHLLEKGVYVWEGRNCFLSTAHTDEDLDLIVRAVKESVAEMRDGGFLPSSRPFDSPPDKDTKSSRPSLSSSDSASHTSSPSSLAARLIPMTEGQKQLWIVAQMGEEASRAYNESITLTLRGALNIEAMRRAVQKLFDRHEALRASFSADGENQIIAAGVTAEVPLIDFSAAQNQQQLLDEWLSEEAQRPFNLEQGSLIRVRLARVAEQHHLLVLTFHHLIFDGWSFGILLRELKLLYQAECLNTPAQMGAPTPYGEFVQWQKQLDESREMAHAEEYWLEQFSGEIPVLELPTDRPRPAVLTYRGARQSLMLEAGIGHKLKSFSAQHGQTLFMTLLAGYELLLHRLSGQDELVVGIASAGQAPMGRDGLVGYCVNLLPLKSRSSGDPTFKEFVDGVRRVVSDAFDNQIYPFARLIKKLQLSRDPSRPPLVTAAFNLDHAGPKLKFHDLEVELDANATNSAKFDLFLNIVEQDDRLMLALDYSTELFDAETARRWMKHYANLLESIVSNPQQRLSELSLLDAAERHQLLNEWNTTRTEFPRGCLHELFEAQVERTPDAVAVCFGDERLSYRELNEKANQLAHYLRSRGVGPDALTGLMMERSIEMIVAMLAIVKAGGAYVPLDKTYPVRRLQWMIEDSGVSVVVTQAGLWQQMEMTADAQLVDVEKERAEIARESFENLESGTSVENLAYVIYTSGSTGIPKGISIPHEAVNRLIFNTNYISLDASDKIAQASNASFDAATFEIWGALLHGAQLVGITKDVALSPLEFATQIRKQGITALFLTTALFNQLASEIPWIFDALKNVLFGGEAVDPKWVRKVIESFAPKRLLHVYGPTESTTFSTWYLVKDVPEDALTVPIGRPISNTEAYVLDKYMQPVPVGVLGELYLGGAGLARNYLQRPELTAQHFVPHPFSAEPGARLYHTGDVVRFRADGNIEFIGRTDHQVKVRGYRIELGEVEAALLTHPLVKEVVVTVNHDSALEHHAAEPRLTAYLVPAQGESLTVSQLHAYLRERMPDYMIPANFVMLRQIPLTANGKVDRRALPEVDGERPQLGQAYVGPRTKAEEVLTSIWAEVLRVERVGVYDNFFELGGDSILSVQIIARARQAGLHLSPKQIFQHHTIAELAAVASIDSAIASDQGSISGRLPLTPIQHWFFEQQLPDPHHFNMALMLGVPPTLNPDLLKQAVQKLLAHHDALRMRFTRDQAGEWQQSVGEEDSSAPFSLVDLKELSKAEQKARIEEQASELQISLNLSEGPLIRVALFDLGAEHPARLLFIVHHLVVDIISWQILLEDLQSLYKQLSQEASVTLPPKTTSFKEWSEKLSDYARSPALKEELEYWLAKQRLYAGRLPVDYQQGANFESNVAHVNVSLSAEETQALLREVPKIYNTQISDALLTALAQACAKWTGESAVLFDLEGHGREALFDDVDLSRTVGWFTTIYPVVLEFEAGNDAGVALKSVKDQLRKIPHGGIGYGLLRYLHEDASVVEKLDALPQAEMSFNYLGRFDRMTGKAAMFSGASENSGALRNPHTKRRYKIEINGNVMGGALHVDWAFSEKIHRRSTIETVAESFIEALRKLIDHCLSPKTNISPAGETTLRTDSHKGFKWSDADLNNIAAAINRVREEA
jgi:amino acid adenylation domain-containing protein/non-ribosomal peptide synthase protein (TIGR01720 family)